MEKEDLRQQFGRILIERYGKIDVGQDSLCKFRQNLTACNKPVSYLDQGLLVLEQSFSLYTLNIIIEYGIWPTQRRNTLL